MKKKTIVYKLVAEHPKLKNTFVSPYTLNRYTLIYEPRRIIRPKVGLIFAFNTFENALRHSCAFQIWEAKTSEIKRLDYFCNDSSIFHIFWEVALRDFKAIPYHFHHLDYEHSPTGTVGCTDLTLIRRIPRDNINPQTIS